jgi:hypothetical protein
MPAGKPAATSETDSMEELSASEIGARFSRMNPDQIQAALARL